VTARYRPTVARVDLEAIRHNVRALKPSASELMAVVKANGYGHGDVEVARAALDAGARWLAVALVEEGIRLRDAGVKAPILVLTEFPPGSHKDALTAGLTPSLYTDDGLVALAEATEVVGRPGRVHLKVDTGMHRVGVPPEGARGLASAALERGLEIEGVWTHLARSEELDSPTTPGQLASFRAALEDLQGIGVRPRYRHVANSGATIGWPETHLDLVRVGIAMYGVSPGPQLDGRVELRPAMSLRSRVTHLRRLDRGEAVSYGHRYRLERDATVATVPVGYADGYFRLLTNRGQVLIRGRRHPVAGTVTMDQLMVDCGDQPVQVGDEVVLFGRQDGGEIRAEEVARWIGTIGYEVVCAVGPRVPREYRG
jgi:alanine racemase